MNDLGYLRQPAPDGDIFSHSFNRMKIGPLSGKRTRGGVTGIWPLDELRLSGAAAEALTRR